MTDLSEKLQRLVDNTLRSKLIDGLVLCVERDDGSVCWDGAAGNFAPDTQFFIASTTKLYTSALVFAAQDRNQLSVDTPVRDILGDAAMHRLPPFERGALSNRPDLRRTITVRHLLSQTSGIPDYFQGKPDRGASLEETLMRGDDTRWDFDDVLTRTATLQPRFLPGTKGKALYSDTNYQLLGAIIEKVLGCSYAEAVRSQICEPLGLGDTYVFTDPADTTPAPLRFKTAPLHIPKAMTSFGPDGGIVSTAQDAMVFLRAFFEGRLFDRAWISVDGPWNPVFFPLEYGLGISRFAVRWFMMPFATRPTFIGHSGLSGAFAFYCPSRKVYLTGTVNQLSSPSLSFRLLIKAALLFPSQV